MHRLGLEAPLSRAYCLALAILLCGGLLSAQDLVKLPADVTLPQSGDSPGKVVFSHATHVAVQAKADCTACHPKLAPILKARAGAKRAVVTHEKMLKGQLCGSCHNSKAAHGFDDCTSCHR